MNKTCCANFKWYDLFDVRVRAQAWARRGASEPPLDPVAAAECGGAVCVKLAEGCASELLGSALCVELVVPLRQGASPRDDGGTLDVLGFADFAQACVVRGPQPVYVLGAALLDDAGELLAGERWWS